MYEVTETIKPKQVTLEMLGNSASEVDLQAVQRAMARRGWGTEGYEARNWSHYDQSQQMECQHYWEREIQKIMDTLYLR